MVFWVLLLYTQAMRVIRSLLVGLLMVLTGGFPLVASVSDAVDAGNTPVEPIIEQGVASWYTSPEPSSLTANGEVFDPLLLTAAHKSLKFGTLVRVTNTLNGKSITVRINDRGPFVAGRIIDLTPAAAVELDMRTSGIAPVTLSLVYEPVLPESVYKRAGDTGWYLLQLGAFSNLQSVVATYEKLAEVGFKVKVEVVDSRLVRLSVRWIPAAQLERTLLVLGGLGFKDILQKSEENPYL